MDSNHSSTKAILYAFLANLGIALAKGAGAIITGSGSMLAETIHSVADCGNQILLYVGLKSAQRKPTKEHPLGFGKAVYFWSFIVAILLFTLGGLFSIFEGIEKLTHDEEIRNPFIAVGILGASLIMESFSLYGAIIEIKKILAGKKLKDWLSATRNAELLVVFGEDLAAISGLAFALTFLLITILTGNRMFDAIGSIVIGGILLLVSFFLMTRVHALLIGRSADPDLVKLIENEIKKEKNIEEIYNIITLQIGPQVMLSAKIRLKEKLTIKQACIIINDLENNIKMKCPEIQWSFIEPDIAN